nr:MAG TPA: hypothetical protein [Podoviridae sp. ctY3D12]
MAYWWCMARELLYCKWLLCLENIWCKYDLYKNL